MNNTVTLAYNLLSDIKILKQEKVLEESDILYLLSSKLSHKHTQSYLGRRYLRYYYAPMVSSMLDIMGGGNFLELGCGTGTQVILAERTGFQYAVGIDMISQRIDIAKKRAAFYQTDDEVTMFSTADFWTLDFTQRFNAIYSMFAFELFGSPPEKSSKRLASFCSDKATIIFDIGRVRELKKQNFFFELTTGLERYGFTVRLEPLFPFFTETKVSSMCGDLGLWPLFRAVRFIAVR